MHILQMRIREVKLTHYTVCKKWQSWEFNPCFSKSKPCSLTTHHVTSVLVRQNKGKNKTLKYFSGCLFPFTEGKYVKYRMKEQMC